MRRAARSPAAAWGLLVACLLPAALGLPGCAKRVVPPVPQGEDYLFAAAAPGEVSADEAAALRAAWSEVIAGDTGSAALRYEKLLKRRPGLAAAWNRPTGPAGKCRKRPSSLPSAGRSWRRRLR